MERWIDTFFITYQISKTMEDCMVFQSEKKEKQRVIQNVTYDDKLSNSLLLMTMSKQSFSSVNELILNDDMMISLAITSLLFENSDEKENHYDDDHNVIYVNKKVDNRIITTFQWNKMMRSLLNRGDSMKNSENSSFQLNYDGNVSTLKSLRDDGMNAGRKFGVLLIDSVSEKNGNIIVEARRFDELYNDSEASFIYDRKGNNKVSTLSTVDDFKESIEKWRYVLKDEGNITYRIISGELVN